MSNAVWIVALDYQRLSTGFDILVLFMNLSLTISGHVFKLIFSFLVNRWLYVVLAEHALLSVQLMPRFLKVLFLDQLFPCSAGKIFLIMLFVVLLPIQVIPALPLNMVRLLIYINNFSWCVSLNQALMVLCIDLGNFLLILMVEKLI